MPAKNVILRKKISEVLYDLLPQTSFDQVINGNSQTLTEIVSSLTDLISQKASSTDLTELQTKFNNLIEDAPEAYDTLKEISDYISTHQDEYSALMALVGNKVTAEEGKGLSTNDFTDELKTKLEELYDKAGIDSLLSEINTNITNLTSRVSTLETEMDSAEGRLDTLESTVSSIQSDLTAAQGNIATIQSQITSITDESNGILAQAKDYTDDAVASAVATGAGRVILATSEPSDLGDYDLWIYDTTE